MSSAFDPYHKWLGIPPAQQPPNFYRLLGIEVFEADRDVIDAAANQRTSYLHDLANGEFVKYSQQLLNEVAAARRCLLNLQQKMAYDAQLRQQLDAAQPPPVTPAAIDEPPPFSINTKPKKSSASTASFSSASLSASSFDIPRPPGSAAPANGPFPPLDFAATAPPVAGSSSAKSATKTKKKTTAKDNSLFLWISLGSAAGLLMLGLVVMIATRDTMATISVRWKTSERDGASIRIDGRSVKLPPSERFTLRVSPGTHEVACERAGFWDVTNSVSVDAGGTASIEVKGWRPASGKGSSRGR